MKVKFIAKWYDLWMGLYWDKKNKWLYILPLPCIGIVLQFKPEEPEKLHIVTYRIMHPWTMTGEPKYFKTKEAAVEYMEEQDTTDPAIYNGAADQDLKSVDYDG